jgi:glycerate dehydrogenase
VIALDRGIVLDLGSIDRGDMDLTRLEAACGRWRLHASTRAEELAERLNGAEVVVTNKVVLDRSALQKARPRLVCVAATGTNNLDLQAARELGIAVTNVTAYATPSVVQHVFALMLAHATRLLDYREAVRKGAWAVSEHFCLLDFPIRELKGKTLGIIGFGELGRGVARAAEAFDMRVLVGARPGSEPSEGRLSLHDLLPLVDVLSLHCPLTEQTRNLIGAAELARMRPDALLVNTARGGIVDEAALADALRRGVIGGAAVDVLTAEPPASGNPLLASDLPNLILTPHTAWASSESRQRLVDEVAANIRAFVKGENRNRVV